MKVLEASATYVAPVSGSTIDAAAPMSGGNRPPTPLGPGRTSTVGPTASMHGGAMLGGAPLEPECVAVDGPVMTSSPALLLADTVSAAQLLPSASATKVVFDDSAAQRSAGVGPTPTPSRSCTPAARLVDRLVMTMPPTMLGSS